jgi:hypothetical protein
VSDINFKLLIWNENLYQDSKIATSRNLFVKNEMGWACGAYEGRGLHRVLVGKPEGRRPLWRPRRRWEDNIKMDLQEGGFWTGWSGLRIGTGGGHL